ncbi:MAG TPA: nuclear transport factor 2 family protein [Allosphingosinicella sp.]|nr:nuclear transport factor 2 family protein [Allosphingosinicella sp.]
MTDTLEHSPASRLRQAYRAWSESKGADHGWLDLLADDVEMRSVLAPELPDDFAAPPRRGKAAAMEYVQTLGRDWEMIHFTPERFIDGGDDVVMVGSCAWRNRATGRIVDTPKVDVWHFEGGRAVSFLEMFDSLAFMRAIPFGDSMGLG